MTEAEARTWCETLARGRELQDIHVAGRLYLQRYFVAGWTPTHHQPGAKVFLHHFVASDPATEVHSHPWDRSWSLILVGGYREQRCEHGHRTEHVYRPGDVNMLDPSVLHRIDLLGDDCWSLFLAGEYRQPWGFSPVCDE